MNLFKKKSTGVQISEYFMKVNETPEEAVARASREYDLPDTVYYDKSRNILKAIADESSQAIVVTKQLSDSDSSKKEQKESLTEKEIEQVSDETKDNWKNPELFGKTSKLGMGIPKLRSIDTVDLDEDILKNKPFFKKKNPSSSIKRKRVNDDELSHIGGEDE